MFPSYWISVTSTLQRKSLPTSLSTDLPISVYSLFQGRRAPFPSFLLSLLIPFLVISSFASKWSSLLLLFLIFICLCWLLWIYIGQKNQYVRRLRGKWEHGIFNFIHYGLTNLNLFTVDRIYSQCSWSQTDKKGEDSKKRLVRSSGKLD